MLATFAESVGVEGPANYAQFLTSAGVASASLITSLAISAASVVLCGIVGVGMAFLLKRFAFPGRRLIEAFILVPAALPPLIGAISFQLLYSDIGILPRGLQQFFGADHPVLPFDGIAGVLVVHTFTMYPFFYLTTSAALPAWTPPWRRRPTTWRRAGCGCGARSCCRCSPRHWCRPRCWSS